MATSNPLGADSTTVEPSPEDQAAVPEGQSTQSDDLAKRLEAAESRAAALEQQLKSAEGRKRKRGEVDELSSGLKVLQDRIGGLYDIMGQAFSDSNPEIADYVRKTQESMQTAASRADLQRQVSEMDDFFSELNVEDPLLKSSRDAYQRAYELQNWSAMQAAYSDAQINVRVVSERERIQAEAEHQIEQRIIEAKKKSQDEADVFNIDGGTAGRSAATGLSDDEFYERWGNFEVPANSENRKRATEIANRRQGVA